MSGWIGVDLDGTLAHYDGWKGIDHVGDPIQPMLERVKRWLSEGREVRIFTARVTDEGTGLLMGTGQGAATSVLAAAMRELSARPHIEEWCLKHIGQVLPITNVKDFGMVELWDDRAVQVQMNTGIPYGPSTRGLE